ncbi:hypothetical protein [Bradyrhizobium sp.]|uniref:hypothetical protein n=1 Tax=Bradyrhizobium sp. TaxID=376 RepID=UPI0025BBCCAD|nr:hypothetical protein [Bradyrhizobium sp.]
MSQLMMTPMPSSFAISDFKKLGEGGSTLSNRIKKDSISRKSMAFPARHRRGAYPYATRHSSSRRPRAVAPSAARARISARKLRAIETT